MKSSHHFIIIAAALLLLLMMGVGTVCAVEREESQETRVNSTEAKIDKKEAEIDREEAREESREERRWMRKVQRIKRLKGWHYKTDESLRTAVKMLNKGECEQASEALKKVKRWKVYRDTPLLMLANFSNYISYLNENPLPTETYRRFMLFYADQLEQYGMKMMRWGAKDQVGTPLLVCCMIREKMGEPKNYHHAELLWRGSTSLVLQYEYQRALPYMKEAYELLCDLKSPKHMKSVTAALALGNAYLDYGYYPEAEKYLRLAMQGKKSISYAAANCQLGQMYINLGDYEQAEACYIEAMKLDRQMRKVDGFYETVVMSLAYCEEKKKNPDAPFHSVIEYMYTIGRDSGTVVIDKILEELTWRSPRKPEYTMLSRYAGRYFHEHQDYEQALYWDRKCRHSAAIVYGKHHRIYGDVLMHMGMTFNAMDSTDKALCMADSSAQIYKRMFTESVAYLSSRQRSQYWHTIRHHFQNEYPLLAYRTYPKARRVSGLAYDNELFTKGLLLSSSEAVRLSILESGDSVLIGQWTDLTARRQAIMALQNKNPRSPLIARYEEEAEALEQALTRSSAAYREDLRQWNITWDSVKAALKPDQVAIEYMTAPLNEDSTVYCALLLRDTCSAPILIPLFEEKEVAGLLNTSTADSADIRRTYAYADNGKKLSTIIWQHITPYLNINDEVFFSPTGVLHQIAIENLPLDSSRIMAEAYQLVRLSSTRELVLNKPSTPHEKAALYGNIYYTADEATMLAYHQPYEHIALSEDVLLASNTRSVQRGSAKNLPGTKKEIDSIAPILQKKHVAVQIYTAYEANEESLKSLSGTHQNILHLATHGFYWPDSTAQKEKYFTQRTITEATPSSIDPLERCGLLFAGANNAYTGHRDRVPEKAQDGILTAKEISLLDFRKADVVVLSACETGLGDISGDGVFGLQRAFKMAGAQTLLMALWQVSDDATQRLMTAFYRHMSDGLSKREAFRRAQQEVRNYTPQKEVKDAERGVMQDNYKKRLHPAANGGNQPSTPVVEQPTTVVHPYASPYYWAGFVLLD